MQAHLDGQPLDLSRRRPVMRELTLPQDASRIDYDSDPPSCSTAGRRWSVRAEPGLAHVPGSRHCCGVNPGRPPRFRCLLGLLALLACAHCSSDDESPAGDGDTGDGDTGDGDTGDGDAADFYTPAPIADAVKTTRAVTWTPLGQAADLTRFCLGPNGGDDLFVATVTDGAVDASLSLGQALAGQAQAADGDLLSAMFKFIAVDGGFRIQSTMHANYALDRDGDAVVLRDIRGIDSADAAGYLVFTLGETADGRSLRATARHGKDGRDGFVVDAAFEPASLTLSGDALRLGDEASALSLYQAPIDFDLPHDMNPDAIARVSNAEFRPTEADALDNPLDRDLRVFSDYADQVETRGPDDATTAAAQAMLQTIEAALDDEGAALRYPPSFYLTFRTGIMTRKLLSEDSFDGRIGQVSVPFVYFTNEVDDDGAHHPFMVIATYGLPDSLSLLWDVPRPPGDGLMGRYPDQSVTRHAASEAFLTKIPLRDYGLVDDLSDNIMVNDLASDEGETHYDHHNYASVSATGIAIDGVVIYPSYNNTLHFAQSAGELSTHGMHSGRGLGLHYHADGHSASGEGLNLYNAADYEGHRHPPIISMGFDGIAGYGAYPEGDDTSDGADVPLDDWAGHNHGDYGYHYHSTTSVETTEQGNRYTAHMIPPRGAWRGRINDIPGFWFNDAPDYNNAGRNQWVGRD